MTEAKDKLISVKEAWLMLENNGQKVSLSEAEMILNYLAKIAEIIVSNEIIKP